MVSVQLAPAAVAVTVKVVVLVAGVMVKLVQPLVLPSVAAKEPLNCSSVGVTVAA